MMNIKRIALICAIALTLSVTTSCSQEAISNNGKDSETTTTQVTENTTESSFSDTSISESETESTTESSASDDDSSKKDSSNTESSKSDSSAAEKKTTTTKATTKQSSTTTTSNAVTNRGGWTVTYPSTTKSTTRYVPPATSKATTKATTKATQSNVTVYGNCKFCGKSCTSANGVKFNRTANPANPVYLILCNSCKDTKCLFCGKACNSSNANKSNAAYYGQNIGYYWRCYTCCPHLKPWQGNEKEAINAANDVVKLTNSLRSANGLNALKTDGKLTNAAQIRAKELAVKYSHTRPNGQGGVTIIYENYSDPHSTGENIQMGYGTGFDDATSIYNAWLNSTGHKATMLRKDYNYIGVGVYYVESNGQKYTYAVQLFANL